MVRRPIVPKTWYFFSTHSSRSVDCDRTPYFGEQCRDLLLNLYRKLDENNSTSNQQVHNTVQQYIQTVVHDGIQSCGIKFCTFSCSPPRRGAPRRDVWKAESLTKHLCISRSVNAWARLLTDNYRRGYTRT